MKIAFKLIFLIKLFCCVVWAFITIYINKGRIFTYCWTFICGMGCSIYMWSFFWKLVYLKIPHFFIIYICVHVYIHIENILFVVLLGCMNHYFYKKFHVIKIQENHYHQTWLRNWWRQRWTWVVIIYAKSSIYHNLI